MKMSQKWGTQLKTAEDWPERDKPNNTLKFSSFRVKIETDKFLIDPGARKMSKQKGV